MPSKTIPSIITTLDQILQGKSLLGNKPGIKRVTKIVDMNPIPNSRQLVVKGLSQGTKLYTLTMSIFDVQYNNAYTKDFPLTVKLKNGTTIFAAQLPVSGTRVQVRCTCPDFYFRWWYWNNKNKVLSGPPMPPYVRKTTNYPEVNPLHIPGACKHLISLTDRLIQSRILVK